MAEKSKRDDCDGQEERKKAKGDELSPHQMEQLLKRIPKAELHLHIEGTLEPELMFEIAQRNNVKLRFSSVEELREAYKFADLQAFLDIYYEGAGVLLVEQDFYDLTWAYLQRAAADNVKHVEIFFDPQTHTSRGVSMETVVGGIARAQEHARTTLGLSSYLIMCFLRHLSGEDALATLDAAASVRDRLIGVGLDSGERDRPPSLFLKAYERAAEQGLRLVAHAGEEAGPEYMWEALMLLKVSRIEHGVRCVEDPRLVALLAEKQIPLTMCPVSNQKIGVCRDLSKYPLKTLLHQNVCVTVNSDDPAYFGAYIADNYIAVYRALGLSVADVRQLARNSFNASFLPPADRDRHLAAVDDVVNSFVG